MTRRRKTRGPKPTPTQIASSASTRLSPFLETELAELEAVIGESAESEANPGLRARKAEGERTS